MLFKPPAQPPKEIKLPLFGIVVIGGIGATEGIVARLVEMRILERLGEKVQLAAGIDENRQLDEAAMQRGLDCLRRFAQLVNHLPQGAVRVVGTNALREARNRAQFIRQA